ncbi:MAG TPA: hypothetical protein VHD56_18375 [Tepidisphaeraceae bacterium]|nr:hypothetical protein [Tepidisphaeraceae bacterium]
MTTNQEHDDFEESALDKATSRRLSKLRTVPVDTSHLDRLIRTQIPRAEQSPMRIWIRPLRALAASVAIVALIGALLLSWSAGPVMASAVQMAQVHKDLIAGRLPVEKVDSIEQANQSLAAQWPDSPQLSGVSGNQQPPAAHVMACCMKSVKNKKMACVLLQSNNLPVTVTMANSSDVKLPSAPVIVRDGFSYRVETVGKLNMVMTERNDRWICLIAELPSDQLVNLAKSLQF